MSLEDPLNEPTARALQVMGRATGDDLADARKEMMWQRVAERSTKRSVVPTVASFAGACAVGTLVAFAAMRGLAPGPRAAAVTLAASSFEPAVGARVHSDASVAKLDFGQMRARASGAPRRVVTPQVSVLFVDARVLVDVMTERTTFFVEEGEVTYTFGSGTRRARAGQRVIVPEGLPIAAAPSTPCEGDCVTRSVEAARGDGLAAQTALYELAVRANEAGQLDTAAGHFREYRRRFPDGVLAPETSIALMVIERSLGDVSAARAEADAFLSRFSADPRAVQVAKWREGLR